MFERLKRWWFKYEECDNREFDMQDCTCEGWKTGNPQLLEAFTVAHEQGFNYTGECWSYCPWCARKLKKVYVK